jgi:hypothetical protein
MTRIAFVDTETTGLSLDDDIWEFAANHPRTVLTCRPGSAPSREC